MREGGGFFLLVLSFFFLPKYGKIVDDSACGYLTRKADSVFAFMSVPRFLSSLQRAFLLAFRGQPIPPPRGNPIFSPSSHPSSS